MQPEYIYIHRYEGFMYLNPGTHHKEKVNIVEIAERLWDAKIFNRAMGESLLSVFEDPYNYLLVCFNRTVTNLVRLNSNFKTKSEMGIESVILFTILPNLPAAVNIEWLSTHELSQRRGFAKRLMRLADHHMYRKGMRLLVAAVDTVAYQFYTKQVSDSYSSSPPLSGFTRTHSNWYVLFLCI